MSAQHTPEKRRDRAEYWRERSAQRRQDPAYREAQRARYKAWQEKNGSDPERLARKAEQMRRYAADAELRVRHAARRAVRTAIESGAMVPQPCFICGCKAEAHHVAYDLPLVVTWLCKPHHREVHNDAKAAGGTS